MCGDGAEQALGLSVVGRAAGSKKTFQHALPVAREPRTGQRAVLGIEPRTSRTQSENHATRQNSQ